MPRLEIETKFLLSPHEAERLRDACTGLCGPNPKIFERNILFDFPDRRFAEKDARLRFRIRQPQEGPPTCEFCYRKRLEQADGLRQEEEVECAFSTDAEMLMDILRRMGLEQVSSYERYRETYIADTVKLTLDTFAFGHLFEIEGDKEQVADWVTRLELDPRDASMESCDDIYARLCHSQGKEEKADIQFGDADMPVYVPIDSAVEPERTED